MTRLTTMFRAARSASGKAINKPRIVATNPIAIVSRIPRIISGRAVLKSGGNKSADVLKISSKYPNDEIIGILIVTSASINKPA